MCMWVAQTKAWTMGVARRTGLAQTHSRPRPRPRRQRHRRWRPGCPWLPMRCWQTAHFCGAVALHTARDASRGGGGGGEANVCSGRTVFAGARPRDPRRWTCPLCRRTDFVSAVGLRNHCRQSHRVNFSGLPEMVLKCGVVVVRCTRAAAPSKRRRLTRGPPASPVPARHGAARKRSACPSPLSDTARRRAQPR